MIIESCSKGYIKNYSVLIPSNTIDSYNRLLVSMGHITGWKNEEKFVLKHEALVEKVSSAYGIYDQALNVLEECGLDKNTLSYYSPVLVLEMFFNRKCGDDKAALINNFASTGVFASISLVYLSLFRSYLGELIGSYKTEWTETDMEHVIMAQSHLLVAQDAGLKAHELLFDVQKFTYNQIYNSDIVRNQLEIEKYHYHRYMGGKNSNRPPQNFEKSFKEVFDEIVELDKNNQLDKKHVALLIKGILEKQSHLHNIFWTFSNSKSIGYYEQRVTNMKVGYLSRGRSGKTKEGTNTAIQTVIEHYKTAALSSIFSSGAHY